MPHTSRRKKKSDRPKRVEVTDEEGWTRITTNTAQNAQKQMQSVSGRDYRPSTGTLKEPYTDWEPMEDPRSDAPPEANIRSIQSNFDRANKLWQSSDSHQALRAALTSRVDKDFKILHCTIFGSGTLCGYKKGWIARHDVALVQTAIFLSVVDAIGTFSSVY